MLGKLVTKSKVMQSYRPKSQCIRRRIKRERANTPQRWSRRIRSLPPIPINVLKTRRKMKHSNDFVTDRISTSYIDKFKTNNFLFRDRQKNIYVNKNSLCGETAEIVRIVPVVIYVKKPTNSKVFTPEEVRVHIDDNPTCQMVSKAIDSHIQQKIKTSHHNIGHSHKAKLIEHMPLKHKILQCKRKSRSTKKY